jgi:phospho-N-acetylmuramoyl-pentapeptide-transferase
MSLIFGNKFIALSKRLFKTEARAFTPANHREKDNIPTLGGLFILAIVITNMLLWCNWDKPEMWLFIIVLTGFGSIGLMDDLCKIWYKKGITARTKMGLQIITSLLVTLIWILVKTPSTSICLPFFKSYAPELGILFIPWIMFILIGTSNAVNLTDGLDGLAIGTLISNFTVFSLVCYLAGHRTFSEYLHIPFAGTAEIAVIGAIFIGASLGFLWFNAHPAQIFMGDVGSLALGAALAMMAIMPRQEILLAIAGGMFVLEAISVITQLGSWKLYRKKLFKMAPIHHHFELLGWKEPKITVRFNIISFILCLLALVTLKIR